MAGNFKIHHYRQGDSLQLNLAGDFDGSSAHELLNVLKKAGTSVSRVVINTDNLRKILAFGRVIFHTHYFTTPRPRGGIIIMGRNARKLAPKEVITGWGSR